MLRLSEQEMLKITKIDDEPEQVMLKVEGQLVAEWAGEMEAECRRCMASGRKVLLDLADVTLLDDRGIRMLKRIILDGVGLVNCSALINGLLNGGGSCAQE